MPLYSAGIFVCGLNLRAKKYNYWIVNLVADTEAGTGGRATATCSLSD